MRLIVLSQYYWPEPVPKPHQLAVGLRERGHEVVAVTTVPNYPAGRAYDGYRVRPWQIEFRDGIRIIRVGSILDHSASAIWRSSSYLSFAVSAGVLGTALSGPADAVYVWHPPLTIGVAAWLFQVVRRAPFLYGLHDLWPEAVEASGMLVNPTALAALRRLERFVYRHAAAIGVISTGFRNNLVGKGVPGDKITVLTDWADPAVFRPLPADGALAEQVGMGGRFNVLFAGNMGVLQNLEAVLEAAGRLQDLPDVQVTLMGGGVERERLQALARGASNVRFVDARPASETAPILALADVLLVHLKPSPLMPDSVPSKTFAYMACGKPILMAVAGEAEALVERVGAGIACTAADPDAIASGIRKFYHMSPDERQTMGQRGLETFQREFSRDVLVARHEEALMQMVARYTRRSGG